MGRKPIGKKPMTDTERQRRRYAALGPLLKLETVRRKFLDLSPGNKAAFIDWLKERNFIK
jgi:hypothetical protein